MKTQALPHIETPDEVHTARKTRRKQRLLMLATYRTEGGIHEELDEIEETERLVRGVLGRGQ